MQHLTILALAIAMQLQAAPFPQSAVPDQWQQSIDLAERLQEQHKLAEARTVLLGAVEEASKHAQKEHRLAYTYNNLGSVAQDQGRYLEAETYYRRSIAHWQNRGAGPNGGLARTMNNLASLMYGAGRLREAEELVLRAETFAIGQLSTDDDEAGVRFLNRGMLYLSRRKYEKAEESYRRALAIWESHRGSHEWDLGRVARDLGFICEKTGRRERAASHYEFARKIWEEYLSAMTATPEMYRDLAALYSALGQKARARLTLEHTLEVTERELGVSHPVRVSLLLQYASVLRQTGEKREAARIEREAKEIGARSEAGLIGQTVAMSDLAQKPRRK
jgi:tetratricopeptide (TPR) repeat protein